MFGVPAALVRMHLHVRDAPLVAHAVRACRLRIHEHLFAVVLWPLYSGGSKVHLGTLVASALPVYLPFIASITRAFICPAA